MAAVSTPAGSGSCTRMPWMSGRRFRPSTAATTSAVETFAGREMVS
jgi:hypothetical protein